MPEAQDVPIYAHPRPEASPGRQESYTPEIEEEILAAGLPRCGHFRSQVELQSTSLKRSVDHEYVDRFSNSWSRKKGPMLYKHWDVTLDQACHRRLLGMTSRQTHDYKELKSKRHLNVEQDGTIKHGACKGWITGFS